LKIVLIGNYENDRSVSMSMFARSLQDGLMSLGHEVKFVAPKTVFGSLEVGGTIGKWIGYIDKYILFYIVLRRQVGNADVVHVCDHGNAMYCLALSKNNVVITCHDMLAIRGALGEQCDCPSSLAGKVLQKWICCGLARASRVVCVSKSTLQDSLRLLRFKKNPTVILNGLHRPFHVLDFEDIRSRLSMWPALFYTPYILHVGSNLKRKNREGVLRIFSQIAKCTDLNLVIAGEPLSSDLSKLSRDLNVQNRIIQIENPSTDSIEALYCQAVALLFPSRFEGFGWPPIEAQACGCPVVASNIPPILETMHGSAILCPVDAEDEMAEGILRMYYDFPFRNELIKKGQDNVGSRFGTSRMINAYLDVYQEVCRERN